MTGTVASMWRAKLGFPSNVSGDTAEMADHLWRDVQAVSSGV